MTDHKVDLSEMAEALGLSAADLRRQIAAALRQRPDHLIDKEADLLRLRETRHGERDHG